MPAAENITPGQILFDLSDASIEGCSDLDPCNCAVCGGETSRGKPYKRWQGANFTNQNKLRLPGSGFVCEPCCWVHAWSPPPGLAPEPGKKKGKNVRLFSNFWEDGEPPQYRYWNKADKAKMREWLARPKSGAWFAAIADSGQKHILPWTPINPTGSNIRRVRFEETTLELGDWQLVTDLCEILTDGVTKGELETGDFSVRSWRQSREELQEFEDRWRSLRGSAWYGLAVWLAQRDEDEHKRRSDGRKHARKTAAPDRPGHPGDAGRVPDGRSKPAQALGSDPGPGTGGSKTGCGRTELGDAASSEPKSRSAKQLPLFGDDQAP